MKRLLQHPLVRRLPFLLVVALGLLFWRTGYLPHSRTLVWRMPADRSIREVEIQLYQGEDLFKRETFELPQGPQGDLVEHVSLGRKAVRELVDEPLPGIALDPCHPLTEAACESVVAGLDGPLALVDQRHSSPCNGSSASIVMLTSRYS